VKRDLLLLAFGLALGVGAGLLIGRGQGEPDAPAAETTSPPADPARPAVNGSRIDARSIEGRSGAAADELDACQRALMNSWMNASHPIEVSERESSREAARRFNDAYYGDDDPAKVEAFFENGGPDSAVDRALADGPLERGEVRVSCDPLPCVMEMDLRYPGGEDLPLGELSEAFRNTDELLAGPLMESLPGYGLLTSSVRGSDDPSQRTLHGIVTTHSKEDLDDLVASMILFAEETLGEKRFDE
jgi:hypothetical protein